MATHAPNKERLRQWVRALKSGAYEQGAGYMRTQDNKYCCLGVAIDIALANGCQVNGNIAWGKTADMPQAVGEWYGIQRSTGHNDPELVTPGGVLGRSAASLNDNGVPFAVIADRIVHTFGLDSD
jgi:hypothetical protein